MQARRNSTQERGKYGTESDDASELKKGVLWDVPHQD